MIKLNLNEVAKIVAKVENSMEREVYVDKISLEYKVSKDAIYAEINKLLYANSRTEQNLKKGGSCKECNSSTR